MEKICGIYIIINTVTDDFYIGSSKDIKSRWCDHKKPSTWKRCPNKQLYQDMQKYGIDKFEFQLIEEVESEQLKETEQKFIEILQPTYNSNRAKGWNVERHKERHKERNREYRKTHKNELKEYKKKHDNQLCRYNGKILTLGTLSKRFYRAGIKHPIIEAKKYLIL